MGEEGGVTCRDVRQPKIERPTMLGNIKIGRICDSCIFIFKQLCAHLGKVLGSLTRVSIHKKNYRRVAINIEE